MDIVPRRIPVKWTVLAPFGQLRPSEKTRGQFIVAGTTDKVFPIDLESLLVAVDGYFIGGSIRVKTLVSMDRLFLMLDLDGNALIDKSEFVYLPNVLDSLDRIRLNGIVGRSLTTIVSPLTGEDIL